ncbi:MAG: response regulator [Gemmataceae bacterium]
MATILIVDDHPTNREFLFTLLGYCGHRLMQAADGADGLAITRAEKPDLVIADILMPTMDGYEFVRRLRADPAVAGTRVIFYTAHYHEPEARNLAAACGVSDVLTKPCEPEVVLRTVEAALGHTPSPTSDAAPAEFDREHLHLLTDKLSQKANELRRTNERLTAMVELGLKLGSERDPSRLLQVFADAAREIVGARYAVVGVPNRTASYRHFVTCGMDAATISSGRPAGHAGWRPRQCLGGRAVLPRSQPRGPGRGRPPDRLPADHRCPRRPASYRRPTFTGGSACSTKWEPTPSRPRTRIWRKCLRPKSAGSAETAACTPICSTIPRNSPKRSPNESVPRLTHGNPLTSFGP